MVDRELEGVVAKLAEHYGERLLSAVLFGSRARARFRPESDWDLLLVLTDDEPIRRDLYREWDEEVAPGVDLLLKGVSPHFVHLPANVGEPSSLWLEIAMAHDILHDPSGRLTSRLEMIRSLVEQGRFERRAVHGLSYWRGVA